MEEKERSKEDLYPWINAILEALIGKQAAGQRKFKQLDNYMLAGLCIGEITILRKKLEQMLRQKKILQAENERLRTEGLELDFTRKGETDEKF